MAIGLFIWSKPSLICNSVNKPRECRPSTTPGVPLQVKIRKRNRSVLSCYRTNLNLDEFYMRRCIELARNGIGNTNPNPMVGCVVVKDGEIVGEGYHPKAGQPHAEVFALLDAGQLAENATVYVNLEPCDHHGRTPPCTHSLISAKVNKVVIGMIDPNPIVASRGIDRLRCAGIHVIVGEQEELCKRLNAVYVHNITTGRPFVTLRYSLSLNGNVPNLLGKGADRPGGYYSQLLKEHDAIVLFSPLMHSFSIPESKEPDSNQPAIIIVPKTAPFSAQFSSIPEHAAHRTTILADRSVVPQHGTMEGGLETNVLDPINLEQVLEYCKNRKFCSVLVDVRCNFAEMEGFVEVGIVKKKLFQRIIVEILPLWDDHGGVECFKGKELNGLKPKIVGENIILDNAI